jgi:hypothetical protein
VGRNSTEIVEGLGWHIAYERETGGLSCTNELEWIWKRSHGALTAALLSYEHAFHRNAYSAQARVIKGLGAFWIKYPDADPERLAKSMEGQTVDGLYHSGKSQASENYFLKSVWEGIRYVLILGYNRGYKKGRLEV